MTKPWMVGDAPWIRSAASGTKLSTPRNVAVARIRQAITAGRPRRARSTPAGNSRWRKTTARADAGDGRRHRRDRVGELQADHDAADAGRGPERQRDARRPVAVRRSARTRAIGRTASAPTASASGTIPRNTQRQPRCCVIAPESAGASRLGSTQPADRMAYIIGWRSSGNARLISR